VEPKGRALCCGFCRAVPWTSTIEGPSLWSHQIASNQHPPPPESRSLCHRGQALQSASWLDYIAVGQGCVVEVAAFCTAVDCESQKEQFDVNVLHDTYTEAQLQRLAARYAAEVTMTDRWIGHVLAQMDVMSLWENTMVVLISDHGTHLGEHKRTGKHSVRGWAEPWPLYEEVTHIPLLVYVPGGGLKRRVRALAQPPDLMPTVLDICGVAGPEMHGHSWLPLLTGERRANWDVVYSSRHTPPEGVNDMSPSYCMATTPKWTYVCAESGHQAELYDMTSDPGQGRNVAAEHPRICGRLQRDAIAFLREQGATEPYVDRFL